MATQVKIEIPRAVYFALEDAVSRMRANAENTQFKSDAQVGIKWAAQIEEWLKDKTPGAY